MPIAKPSWSHSTDLTATPGSVSASRAFVRRHLLDHRLLLLVDPVRIVVSELATNALVHGRTPFSVTLAGDQDTVRLTVRDRAAWVRRDGQDDGRHDGLDAGGRGLGIVNVLSNDWGIVAAEGWKSVWATFDARRGVEAWERAT